MIDNIYKAWNIQALDIDEFSGYENVMDDLNFYTKAMYNKDKEQVIDDVFNIYRSVNIVPITYYSENGLIKAIQNLTRVTTNQIVNNTLGLGNNTGQTINRFLFPNMMDAEVHGVKNNSLRDRFYNDVKLKRAIKICFEYREGNNLASPSALRRALDLVSGGNIQNFKALNARSIVENLNSTLWGSVYDPSAGYGGRMLGITTSKMMYDYIGCEPNTTTYKHLLYLSALIEEAIDRESTVVNSVSEDLVLEKNSTELAFTSPPYFNLEKYSTEETQCMNRYKTLDQWFEGYVEPTIRNIKQSLTSNGILAINIADYKLGKEEFKIEDRWKTLTQSLGFKHTKTIKMLLNSRPGVGNEGRQKYESVYCFTKH